MISFKKLLKEKFLITLIIDIIFFIIFYFSIQSIYNFLRDKVYSIALYGPDLQEISAQLQNQTLSTADLTTLSSKLDSIQNLTNQITLLMILLPLSALIIYILFQGTSWNYILSQKLKFNKRFMFKFSITSLIFLIPVYIFARYLFDKWEFDTSLVITIILGLLMLYLMFISYQLTKNKLKELFKQTFLIGFKKFIKLFSIITASFGLILLTYVFFKEFMIIFYIISIVIFSFTKLIFYYFFSKN